MSPMEIWCNESQERYVLAIDNEKLDVFESLCARERCPYAVVGHTTEIKNLKVTDKLLSDPPVDMSLQLLLGKPPRMQRTATRKTVAHPSLELSKLDINEALDKVLQSPTVASKNFLITIGDRTVGGLVHRDQMVGPHQIPVADCAVTLSDFEGFSGEVMAMGERSPVAVIDPIASGRIAVAEALTNLAGVAIDDIKNIKLSANWMAAAGFDDAALFDTVSSVARDFCVPLGLSIPVGKDSLSMQTRWQSDNAELTMTAPLSLVVTAFAPVLDVRKTITPQLSSQPDSVLMLVDLGQTKDRLGASVLAQVMGQIGSDCPNIDNVLQFGAVMRSVWELSRSKLMLACHDRSDGGAIVSLLEMCIAGNCGADISIKSGGNGVAGALFSEEAGLLIQINQSDLESVKEIFDRNEVSDLTSVIGTVNASAELAIQVDDKKVLTRSIHDLKKRWWATSYQMQKQRDNPDCAEQEYAHISDTSDPGISPFLSFDPADNIVSATGVSPRLAILREQGVNGNVEMAAAFSAAGFECIDVHMSDVISGRVTLDSFYGLVACGGFSYGDVLGAGGGWANSIRYNDRARDQFQQFFERLDVFALGVCNGCQMFSRLRDLIPGAAHWPDFVGNHSEQFEARVSTVRIEASASILFAGMEDSRIPVAVAHGEGQAQFTDDVRPDVTMRYVDNYGAVTERYPLNPNGSAQGATGLCSKDGRFNIMMPHPERVYRSVQNSFRPANWPDDGPWLRMFRNARNWVSQA